MPSRGFTKPQLDYKLWTLFPSRSWAKDVDRSLCSALKALRKEVQSFQLNKLLACPDQGRSFSLTSKSPASNHWVGTGHHTYFAAYRFATKARSNLLPVRTVLKHTKRTEIITCPKCHNAPESLGHVLNACTPNASMMRERHNAILDRIKKATSKDIGTLFIDQAIPEAPGILRPDLVAKTDTTITIVDVTVPYESGPDAFNSACAEKTQKYSELVEWAKTKYLRSTLECWWLAVWGHGIRTMKRP